MSEALPTLFEADRVFVCPRTTDGTELRFLTDSGGAVYVRESLVRRLSLRVTDLRIGDDELRVVSMPKFLKGASVPPILPSHDPRDSRLRGKLLVAPDNLAPHLKADGILGAPWFAGRVWTIDYPGKRLLLRKRHAGQATDYTVPLGFPIDPSGERQSQFPSIEATIDGATHAFLLDTGATLHLTGGALAQLKGTEQERATCFVTSSLFEHWRMGHPNWRIIEDADAVMRGEPVIEVPAVTVGGLEVGPAWFTRRPDRSFHESMSDMMDRRVDGALGGSLLRFFTVTIDYLNAMATFEVAS